MFGPALSVSRRRGGGVWSPVMLFAAGEQGAWYDPSDFSSQFQDSAGATPVTAAGQPVGKVLDKSGRGNHLVQATVASRPVLQQDGSGFWYWNFDGVDDSWGTAAALNLSGTNKATVWVGAQKNSDASGGVLLEHTATATATDGSFNMLAPNGALANYTQTIRGTVGFATMTSTTYAAPDSRVHSVALDTSAATVATQISPRINAAAPTTASASATPTSAGNFANATLFVGRRNNASSPFNGRVYQLIVRGASSSASDVSVVERFVGGKMGIAL